MLKSYLLVSLRSLLKNKIYSLINISGLAIGLACALVITLFLLDEFSYDRFHHRTDFIYRIVQKQYQNGEVHKVASTPAPMVKTLKNDFPEVLNICLLRNKRSGILQVREKTLEVPQVIATDQGFLDVFDFKLIRGNADMLFTDPGQIVVTDKVARSLFGDTWQTRNDLLGSYITYGKDQQLVLAGIIQEAPGTQPFSSTSFSLSILLRMGPITGSATTTIPTSSSLREPTGQRWMRSSSLISTHTPIRK
jgi:putative ABC transport system permease protein